MPHQNSTMLFGDETAPPARFLFQFPLTCPPPGRRSGWKPCPWTSSAHWGGWICSPSQELLRGPAPRTCVWSTKGLLSNVIPPPDSLNRLRTNRQMWKKTHTKWASCWPRLWGNVAGRNHSSPCSCAPPDTRPAPRRRISLPPLGPGRMGTGRSEGEAKESAERELTKLHL